MIKVFFNQKGSVVQGLVLFLLILGIAAGVYLATSNKEFSFQSKAYSPESKILKRGGSTIMSTPVPSVSFCTACSADLSKDGRVSGIDYSIAVTCVNKGINGKDGAGRSCITADLNKDGRVDRIDVSCVSSQFGKTCTSTPMPTPKATPRPLITPTPSVIPTPYPSATPSTAIDTLDYFLSKHPDKGLDGEHTPNNTDFVNGHPMSQTVSGNKSYYVKWASDVFEVHSWDSNYVYLSEDHSGSGDRTSYTFNPGIWMRRKMPIGEKIMNRNNSITWFNNACVASSSSNFPIEMTLERRDQTYDVGGDLGKQDVIVLKYDSALGLSTGVYERFYYSKEWGWVRWEEFDKATDSLKNRRTFNKIITPIRPNTAIACSKV